MNLEKTALKLARLSEILKLSENMPEIIRAVSAQLRGIHCDLGIHCEPDLANSNPAAEGLKSMEVTCLEQIYKTRGKIYAIKAYKEEMNCSLIDAKNRIEELAMRHGWHRR
jgi:ribosomal protein L7/L12